MYPNSKHHSLYLQLTISQNQFYRINLLKINASKQHLWFVLLLNSISKLDNFQWEISCESQYYMASPYSCQESSHWWNYSLCSFWFVFCFFPFLGIIYVFLRFSTFMLLQCFLMKLLIHYLIYLCKTVFHRMKFWQIPFINLY